MQRWHITAGLATSAVIAAILVPELAGERVTDRQEPVPSLEPEAPRTPPVPVVSGPLSLTASLDQDMLLTGKAQERYLVIEVAAPERDGEERRPVHLAVVMDTSGSMAARGKISNARMAARELADLMGPRDTLSLVTFSSTASVRIPSQAVTDPLHVHRVIQGIQPEGGTNLHDGLTAGMAQIDRPDLEGVKRVVMLSDGKVTMGISDPATLIREAGSRVGSGISVSALGLGLDYDEDLLSAMSDAGGGSYRFVDRPGQLASLFAEELQQMGAVAARETMVDITLPSGITLLELYGYDTVERPGGVGVFLGDIHGGETRKIVARVQVAPAGLGSFDIADVGLTYADAGSGDPGTALADVDVTLTADASIAHDSIDNAILAKATAAHSARLLEESARDWERGDLAANQARLDEAEQLLRDVGSRAGNAALLDEADAYRTQRKAFQAAAPASSEGLYQVKKAKEVSRAHSRR